MRDQFDKIRKLLDELEAGNVGDGTGNSPSLPAVEMAVVIQEIVDDLQPLLTPYQAAFYWHLFRHSIARNGSPLLRIGTRGLQTDVVKPGRRGSQMLSNRSEEPWLDLSP